MKVHQHIGETHGALPAVPSTGAYESALGQAAAGMNAIGKGLAEIVKIGEDLYKKHKEQKRENDLSAMQIEAEKDMLAFKTGYDRSNPDPTNYVKDTEKAWDEIVKKRSRMTKDAITGNAFMQKMNGRKMMILSQATEESQRRFDDQYFAESISNVDEWANLAIGAETLEDATTFTADMLLEIHKGYPFTEKAAGKLEVSKLKYIKTERAKNAEGRVYQDILRDPGGTMQKLMLPPEAGQYPDITEPTKREALRVHAENIYKVKQTEQRTEKARVKKENLEAEEFEIEGLYSTGKLKIDNIWASKFIDKAKWTDRIMAKQRAATVVKTNFGVYAKIQDMIYSDHSKREIAKAIADAADKDLTERAAEGLLNKSTAYTGSMEDHWKKRGYDFLKSKFFTKKDMMGRLLETPEEIDRYLLGLNVLDMEIELARRQGKPLSGMNIVDKAVEIWNGIKLTPSERLEEKIQGIKEFGKERMEAEERKKRGLPPTPAPATPKRVPPRGKTEPFEDYLKRITGTK